MADARSLLMRALHALRSQRTPLLASLVVGFLLQYAVAVGSSFLVYRQGIDPRLHHSDWLDRTLARFLHDPRSLHPPKLWPESTGIGDRPELRFDPFWNPLDPSVWRQQPGVAIEISGVPLGLMQCFEGGGFLGETWVVVAPIVPRDPQEELPRYFDVPTVETVVAWSELPWRNPSLVAVQPDSAIGIPGGYIVDPACSDSDTQRWYWLWHLLDTSTIRIHPPSWVELHRALGLERQQTVRDGRPAGCLARGWGFPFRSVVEYADMLRLDRRWAVGSVDSWNARDWEVLAYDGIEIETARSEAKSDSGFGIAIRPLWSGAFLNSVAYALAMWAGWLGVRVSLGHLRYRNGASRA